MGLLLKFKNRSSVGCGGMVNVAVIVFEYWLLLFLFFKTPLYMSAGCGSMVNVVVIVFEYWLLLFLFFKTSLYMSANFL